MSLAEFGSKDTKTSKKNLVNSVSGRIFLSNSASRVQNRTGFKVQTIYAVRPSFDLAFPVFYVPLVGCGKTY